MHVTSCCFASKLRPIYIGLFTQGYVSGKLPTFSSPKPTFCPKWEVSVKVGLGKGQVGSFPKMYNNPRKPALGRRVTLPDHFARANSARMRLNCESQGVYNGEAMDRLKLQEGDPTCSPAKWVTVLSKPTFGFSCKQFAMFRKGIPCGKKFLQDLTVYFCGLAIFGVLRGLIFAIFRKYPVPSIVLFSFLLSGVQQKNIFSSNKPVFRCF